jgi:signal transduction histidine kinase
MEFLQNMPIRGKQILLMMLTSSIVLVVACTAFSIYEVGAFRKAMVLNLTTLVEIVGNNTSAALDFSDATSAAETLSALEAEPNIIGACIFAKDGSVFARYNRTNAPVAFTPPSNPHPGYEFTTGRLWLCRPVARKGETIGSVYLESDMRGLYIRLWRYAGIVGLIFLASLLFAFVLSSRLQRLISGPILHLAKVARTVALEKNYAVRAVKRNSDELGELVDGFNEMLAQIQARDIALQTARDNLEKRVAERTEELENIHKQLVESSRQSGMAEIATNVLHNVGNVLNSVNISTGLIVDSVQKSKVPDLARVVALMQEHEHDLGTFITTDAKGKHLPIYLARLSEHLIASEEAMNGELEALRRNVEHIKEIVAMQQRYAIAGGVKEVVDVISLVEDSMRMNEGSLSRHGVKVIRDYAKVPPMNVDKHKILQILVNLMRNAEFACDESASPEKQLTVRVANSNGTVKISVIDNGVGIPPENLTRIFNHGFTTRKGGHGFGLHSGALAAKEMGGSLTVQSEGTGRGAAFTLELPCAETGGPHE